MSANIGATVAPMFDRILSKLFGRKRSAIVTLDKGIEIGSPTSSPYEGDFNDPMSSEQMDAIKNALNFAISRDAALDRIYRDEFEDLCERNVAPRRILIAQARASSHNLAPDQIAAFQKLADDAGREGSRP